jgi:hypothetical protein
MIIEQYLLTNSVIQTDWIEASCLFGSDDYISKMELLTMLEESTNISPETIYGNIYTNMNERKKQIKELYPFEIENDGIKRKYNWEKYLPYSFMLMISYLNCLNANQSNETNNKKVDKIFEQMVSICIKHYLGYSINIGFPRQGRMPKKFEDCLEFICILSGEKICEKPEIGPNVKDEGVDIYAWKPIDIRSGILTLLIQCTVEKKWQNSINKINLDTWKKIIDFGPQPQKGMAFPYVCGYRWDYYSTNGGILFDRLRLTKLWHLKETKILDAKMKNYIKANITHLQWFD